MAPKTKDRRLLARRAKAEWEAMFERAMRNEIRDGAAGAEVFLSKTLITLIQVVIRDEGRLGTEIRTALEALCSPSDPLRKDIEPDQWMTIWMAINALQHERMSYLERVRADKERLVQEHERSEVAGKEIQGSKGGEVKDGAGHDARRVGVLGDGASVTLRDSQGESR